MDKKLKVLMLNGSPRENGNIALAFQEMEQVFDENNVEYENILLYPTVTCSTYRIGQRWRATRAVCKPPFFRYHWK